MQHGACENKLVKQGRFNKVKVKISLNWSPISRHFGLGLGGFWVTQTQTQTQTQIQDIILYILV